MHFDWHVQILRIASRLARLELLPDADSGEAETDPDTVYRLVAHREAEQDRMRCRHAQAAVDLLAAADAARDELRVLREENTRFQQVRDADAPKLCIPSGQATPVRVAAGAWVEPPGISAVVDALDLLADFVEAQREEEGPDASASTRDAEAKLAAARAVLGLLR